VLYTYQQATIATPATVATSSTPYDVGDIINAIRSTSSLGSGGGVVTNGYSETKLQLSVPSAGQGGICNVNSWAQYLINVNHTCVRVISNLQTECNLGSSSTVLAANPYIYNLKMAQQPVVTGAEAATTWFDIEFAQIEYFNSTDDSYTTM
jgi:hypothetical protein